MSAPGAASHNHERILLDVVRVLPPHRAEQLVDFARFLQTRTLIEEFAQDEDQAEIDADNARWDALLATDAAQTLMESMADEALAEHRAGKTRPMAFDDRGRLIPG